MAMMERFLCQQPPTANHGNDGEVSVPTANDGNDGEVSVPTANDGNDGEVSVPTLPWTHPLRYQMTCDQYHRRVTLHLHLH